VNGADDANDLRGLHFRRLIRTPYAWIPLLLAVLGTGVVVTAVASAVFGLLAALGALVIGIGVLLWIADSRAADDFFELYAEQRGLVLDGRSDLPSATPLLCSGIRRYAVRTLTGALADGVEGTLALYTYEETTSDGKTSQTSYYLFTLVLIEVPECIAQVSELYCQRKSGLRALEWFEDLFRGSKKRVRLESEALDDRYEIFARGGRGDAWLPELFTPTFIVWLTDSAPKKFAFELVNGTLCCYVKGHKQSAAELDAIVDAGAVVATRLREESLE
jgi:hypothetical protein